MPPVGAVQVTLLAWASQRIGQVYRVERSITDKTIVE